MCIFIDFHQIKYTKALLAPDKVIVAPGANVTARYALLVKLQPVKETAE